MVKVRNPIISINKLKPAVIDTKQAVIFTDDSVIKDVNLEGRKIDELNLNSCDVEKLSLLSSTANEVKIIDSILKKCDFTGAMTNHTFLERTHINNSRLQGSQLMELVARDIVIEKSKCIDLSLRFSKIKDSAFVDCDLTGVDFIGADLRNVIFRNCILKKSQFSQSKLNKVSFKDSDIDGIIINKDSLGGITVNTGQALYLASMLGFTIED